MADPASAANRQLISQSKTPSTRKVEGERGSASSQFDLGECALALAFRLKKIIAHLRRQRQALAGDSFEAEPKPRLTLRHSDETKRHPVSGQASQ